MYCYHSLIYQAQPTSLDTFSRRATISEFFDLHTRFSGLRNNKTASGFSAENSYI